MGQQLYLTAGTAAAGMRRLASATDSESNVRIEPIETGLIARALSSERVGGEKRRTHRCAPMHEQCTRAGLGNRRTLSLPKQLDSELVTASLLLLCAPPLLPSPPPRLATTDSTHNSRWTRPEHSRVLLTTRMIRIRE